MKKTILYCYPQSSSFVKKDLEMLSSDYLVVGHPFIQKTGEPLVIQFLRQFFFLLKNLPKAHCSITMFGGYVSFFPTLLGKIFGKPSFIILGGTDCANFPSINYGNFRKAPYSWFTCWSYHLATQLLPVHEAIMDYEYSYTQNDFPRQGARVFCKNLQTPFTTVYNGFDSTVWYREKVNLIPDSFITVASIYDPKIIILKGIDLIIEMAQRRPDSTFTVVGVQDQKFIPKSPANIRWLGFGDLPTLRQELSRHQFYFQLSISEGFPNALCEAMLCECIPVVSKVSSMPAIIGDSGFVLPEKSSDLLEKILTEALSRNDLEMLGKKARQRVMEYFPLEVRLEKFRKIIQ